MNNLSHKVAVASIGIVLGFALGINKEAKAATIILTPDTSFAIVEGRINGLKADVLSDIRSLSVITDLSNYGRQRNFYEFNIANLSLASTVVSSAIFQVTFRAFRGSTIDILGYRGNGQPDL